MEGDEFARKIGPLTENVSVGDEVPIPTLLLSESTKSVSVSNAESPAKVEVAVPDTVRLPENVPDETVSVVPEMVVPEMVPPVMVALVMVPPVMAGVVKMVLVSWSILLVKAIAWKLFE